MTAIDYWAECLANAAEGAGIDLTSDQIKTLADAVADGHENYGMAFHTPPAGEHLVSEIAQLKRRLQDEQAKVQCVSCRGRGRIVSQGPYHNSSSQCSKCGGEGRHAPNR